MTPVNLAGRMYLPALLALILTTSFRNAQTDNIEPGNTKAVKNKMDIPQFPEWTNPGPGDLYVLSISGEDFLKLKTDKWVFKFIHIREDAMTLHGWYANGLWGRSFDTSHDIELLPTQNVGMSYKSVIYFGDIVLSRRYVRRIKRLVKKMEVKTILFKPVPYDDTHIAYRISFETKSNQVLDITFDANPSPPKGFN